MASLTIDVISDVVCPWCYIGVHRLETAMRLFDAPVDYTLRFHPYLLDASVPDEGEFIAERIRARYRTDPEAMFDRVNEAARESSLDLDIRKQPRTYPTVKAHTLLRLAVAHDAQLAVAHALFRTHFVDAGNIADPATLVAIGTGAGLDAEFVTSALSNENALAQTRSEAARLAEGGIRGVPFFLFGGKVTVSGAQTAPSLMQAMRQVIG